MLNEIPGRFHDERDMISDHLVLAYIRLFSHYREPFCFLVNRLFVRLLLRFTVTFCILTLILSCSYLLSFQSYVLSIVSAAVSVSPVLCVLTFISKYSIGICS